MAWSISYTMNHNDIICPVVCARCLGKVYSIDRNQADVIRAATYIDRWWKMHKKRLYKLAVEGISICTVEICIVGWSSASVHLQDEVDAIDLRFYCRNWPTESGWRTPLQIDETLINATCLCLHSYLYQLNARPILGHQPIFVPWLPFHPLCGSCGTYFKSLQQSSLQLVLRWKAAEEAPSNRARGPTLWGWGPGGPGHRKWRTSREPSHQSMDHS